MHGIRIGMCALLIAAEALGAYAEETTGTGAAAAGGGAAGKVALELKLPKPMFLGTPKNLNVENLEMPAKAKEPFMVPPGLTNLAQGKSVTSSDNEPIIGDLTLITDGDKEAADGSFVELGPGLQWVQIDLKQASEIYAVVIWHYHQQPRVYHDVIVRVADDKDFISNVQTLFNNDHDNSSKIGIGKDKAYIETNEGKIIDGKGVKGRYVRLYTRGSTSNELNDYIEVEVYGKPL